MFVKKETGEMGEIMKKTQGWEGTSSICKMDQGLTAPGWETGPWGRVGAAPS